MDTAVKVKSADGVVTTLPLPLAAGIGTHRIPGTHREAEAWVERGYKMGEVIGSVHVDDRGPGRGAWIVYYRKSEA